MQTHAHSDRINMHTHSDINPTDINMYTHSTYSGINHAKVYTQPHTQPHRTGINPLTSISIRPIPMTSCLRLMGTGSVRPIFIFFLGGGAQREGQVLLFWEGVGAQERTA